VPAFNFDDDIRPLDIEAVEVDRGSAQLPPQFGGSGVGMCCLSGVASGMIVNPAA
jgi:hypothetical protein